MLYGCRSVCLKLLFTDISRKIVDPLVAYPIQEMLAHLKTDVAGDKYQVQSYKDLSYHMFEFNLQYLILYHHIFGYFVIFMSKGILLVFSLIWHNQILNINKSMLFIFTRRMFVSFDSNFDMHHSTDILVVCNVSLTCFPESKRVFIKRD